MEQQLVLIWHSSVPQVADSDCSSPRLYGRCEDPSLSSSLEGLQLHSEGRGQLFPAAVVDQCVVYVIDELLKGSN